MEKSYRLLETREMIFASIITYNPKVNLLAKLISRLIGQVDRLVIIDNYSENKGKIVDLIDSYNENNLIIDSIFNDSNYGIAYALNQAVDYCINYNCDWLLTMDQDSVIPTDLVSYYKRFCKKRVGQVCCNLTNLSVSDIDISKMSFLTIPINKRHNRDYYKVYACITSGTLLNVTSCKEVGGFDDSLFIDYVDYDLSLKLYYAGYYNVFLENKYILHNFGNAEKKNILGIKYTEYNFSRVRLYYKARNSIVMMKRYPKFKRMFLRAFLYDMFCSLVSLDIGKIISFLRGALAYKKC